ncbi:MAG: hypothetical protein OEZ33_03330 [Gammaproteobacteria bacterium]|nr:hypothetical protein [Gammaproteobacteria bacterium]
MSMIKFAFLSLVILFTPACAFIHSFDENLTNRIDSWIASENYGKALDTLYYIDKQHKDYATLMKKKVTILKLAPKLEARVLAEGKKLFQQKKWHETLEIYEYGLDKLPDSRPIRKEYNLFLTRRAAHLQQLKLKLLQNKTDWLISDSKIRQEMAIVIPRNFTARWMLANHNDDINSTIDTLLECVDLSIADGELDVAKQCLTIARKLTPNKIYLEQIAKAESRLDDEVNDRSRQLSPNGKKSLRLARQALAQGDYAKAKQLHDTLPVQDKKNKQVLEFREKMDVQIADYIDNRIKEGRRLYSADKVQQAYLMWKSLQKLDPENEKLQQLVKRSEHVINKLRKIGDNPQQTVIPPGSAAQ